MCCTTSAGRSVSNFGGISKKEARVTPARTERREHRRPNRRPMRALGHWAGPPLPPPLSPPPPLAPPPPLPPRLQLDRLQAMPALSHASLRSPPVGAAHAAVGFGSALAQFGVLAAVGSPCAAVEATSRRAPSGGAAELACAGAVFLLERCGGTGRRAR